jgi:hypothetical protein
MLHSLIISITSFPNRLIFSTIKILCNILRILLKKSKFVETYIRLIYLQKHTILW